MTTDARVRRLACNPNNYPWGKQGDQGLAAQLAPNASPDFKLEGTKTYAELWMGTHPKNEAKLWGKDETLREFVTSHPDLLGDVAQVNKFPPPFEGDSLHVPFLFKILSCRQALPLQIHPDKELAEQLHRKNPDQFPDTNHKPEIAVCLTDRFLGFAGFRPYEQIRSFLLCTPEVTMLPGNIKEAIKEFTAAGQLDKTTQSAKLRTLWHAFLDLKGDKAVNVFCTRVSREGIEAFSPMGEKELDSAERSALVDAVAILHRYNPGDASIFTSLFFMNLVELHKGEGMYVGADGIHAWLEGDIVELMAVSDNVLNVGFTPEKDSTRLVANAITVTPKAKSQLLLKPQTFKKGKKGKTTVYSTPFEEFSILRVSGSEELEALTGPAVAIVTEGKMTLWDKGERQVQQGQGPGTVYFVGAGTNLVVEGDGEVWMAFYDGDPTVAEQVGPQ